jgi:hypothetical protein
MPTQVADSCTTASLHSPPASAAGSQLGTRSWWCTALKAVCTGSLHHGPWLSTDPTPMRPTSLQ